MPIFLIPWIASQFDRSHEALDRRFRYVLDHRWVTMAYRRGYLPQCMRYTSVYIFTSLYLVYAVITSTIMTAGAIVLGIKGFHGYAVMLGICAWVPTTLLVSLRVWALLMLELVRAVAVEDTEVIRRRRRERREAARRLLQENLRAEFDGVGDNAVLLPAPVHIEAHDMV